MPNIMGVLRAEIRRLARKETKQELATLKKQVTAMRRRFAESRSRLANLERVTKRATAAVALAAAARGAAMSGRKEGGTQIRFSPAWVRSHRRRLRMSRALYARLVGVSAQTIMGWEGGRSRPRRKALQTWRAVREMGVRELKKRLEEGGTPPGRRVARRVRKRRARRIVRKMVRRVRLRKAVRRVRVRKAVRRVRVRKAVRRVRAKKK